MVQCNRTTYEKEMKNWLCTGKVTHFIEKSELQREERRRKKK